MFSRILLSILTIMFPVMLFAQTIVTVQDSDINAGDDVTWTADNIYLLDGLVFVEDGATLNIQRGTVIKGKAVPTTGDNTSALIIARGGKIYAHGQPTQPIVFTAESDDVNDSNDLTINDRGLWGGVILLGYAEINTTTGVGQIEGIASTEPRGAYGGGHTSPNDDDNSGVLRYVSIRHGGAEIGSGNEINGLTMGGVGRATTIEYVEVLSNLDDGFEWFGGTVNCKYLVSAFVGDDDFDYDEGFRGNGQFWFAIKDELVGGGRVAEQDGGTDPEDGMPFAIPTISNVTYIGAGVSNFPQGDGSQLMIFRDNAGGKYYSSIFTDYNGGGGGAGITVEDLASGADSRERLEQGDLVLSNNIWYNFADGNSLAQFAPQQFVADHLAANSNQIVNPQINSASRTQNGQLDPRPDAAGPAASGATVPGDPFFTQVNYYGAFDPNAPLWISGWTALYRDGVISQTITIQDNFINAGESKTLTSNNTYLLDGLVFVEDGATLAIEPGTVIKGKAVPTTGDNTSALIVARGGKIFAQGTQTKPVIFTAESDEVSDPTDLTINDRGLWGGIILLGYAEINTTTGVGQIEGIASTEPRGAYGGGHSSPNDDDNSGVMRYVSIRHGGAEIGSGNEINGLTMGGVGRATTIEYVEVLSNLDDGFEWFGGTVNCKYLVSAFAGDDDFDYDEGFRGKGQFWFAIKDELVGGGRVAEQDGGTDPEDGMPFAIPTISNVTYIGAGVSNFPQGDGSELMIFRDNAGGKYYSSIFTDYNGGGGGAGIRVEDLASGSDSRERLENGDLVLSNNIWYNFADGNSLAQFAPQQFVADHLSANSNQIVDPQINAISRTQNSGLDPRPNASGPAASGATVPGDPFFTQVNYYGAFDPNAPLWTKYWTAIDQDQVTDIPPAISHIATIPNDFSITQNYPNPFNPTTNIRFFVAKPADVKIAVYNIRGQKMATLVNEYKASGEYVVTWNASNLSTGLYFYRFEAGGVVETRKMTLLK